MKNLKTILVVHASDANLHLGYLIKILDTLKEEKRIAGYTTIDSNTVNEDSFKVLENVSMVMVLLTNNIVDVKDNIETLLLDVKRQHPRLRVAEILIDNVPYETSFIVFPTSLEPIKSSEDMAGVWQGIEGDLKRLFPKPEIKPATVESSLVKPVWKKYLPYIFGLLIIVGLGYFLDKEYKIPDVKEVEDKTRDVQEVEDKTQDVQEEVLVEDTASVKLEFMPNSQIVEDVTRDAGVSKQEAMSAIKTVVVTIRENLKKGNWVYIDGLGTWKISKKNSVKTVSLRKGLSIPNVTSIKIIKEAVFIQEIAKEVEISIDDAAQVLKVLSINIEKSLKLEKPISIEGLGKWYIDIRPERTGRNPLTGLKITIPEKRAIKFAVDSDLIKSLN